MGVETVKFDTILVVDEDVLFLGNSDMGLVE